MTVIAFTPHLAPIATALADEGVPVRVISRSMRVPAEDMRSHLNDAVANGDLIDMPADDWPPTARRKDRVPVPTVADIERLTAQARSTFKVTSQQAVVLAVLLTRNEAKKEQLLAAIQQHRTSKSSLPNNLEEPQLKLIDVVICNLRKRIKKHCEAAGLATTVTIETVWGTGYTITRANRDLALKLISEYVTGQQPGGNDAEEPNDFIELAKAA